LSQYDLVVLASLKATQTTSKKHALAIKKNSRLYFFNTETVTC
jgi:hypothetical protein